MNRPEKWIENRTTKWERKRGVQKVRMRKIQNNDDNNQSWNKKSLRKQLNFNRHSEINRMHNANAYVIASGWINDQCCCVYYDLRECVFPIKLIGNKCQTINATKRQASWNSHTYTQLAWSNYYCKNKPRIWCACPHIGALSCSDWFLRINISNETW